ncbi:MAG: hypothetical protein ACJ8FL_05790 [Sphingomicrobium sp.]
MRLLTAIALGALMGFLVPMMFGGPTGVWLNSFASWGTIHPFARSPGLLFSIPIFVLTTWALWTFFNWHDR